MSPPKNHEKQKREKMKKNLLSFSNKDVRDIYLFLIGIFLGNFPKNSQVSTALVMSRGQDRSRLDPILSMEPD